MSVSAERSVFVPAGRLVLWALLVVIAARLVGVIGDEPAAAPASSIAPSAAGERWPDEEARAYAVAAARAYLTFSPRHPEYQARALRPYLASELREQTLLAPRRAGVDQTVEDATVARVRRLGTHEALITVAATVIARTVSTRYLTVPVARDRRGGLAVFDLPSFAAPPQPAERTATAQVPVQGDDAGAIEGLLRRFLPLYLAGQPVDQLAYFLAPGARVVSLGSGLEARAVDGFIQVGEAAGPRRVVLAMVRVRDLETKATYVQRYRVEVIRRERWYVRQIVGANDETPTEGSQG